VISDLKAEATARGLNWSDVRAAFEMVREQERDKRAHGDDVRRSAWHLATALEPHLGCYWKYGFANPWKRWPKLLERDYTIIPNHDVIAQEVASHFPEYHRNGGTEQLFNELLAQHDPMPSRETMFAAAMDMVEAMCASDAADVIPF
jgi:hypothetical protein